MIRKSLFTSNFRKRVERTAAFIAFILLFAGTCKMLNYLYVDVERGAWWERILMHDFYSQEDNIDYLHLGSSHVYCDLNPVELDEINGKNNFNLATSAQKLSGAYFLLQEADKYHDFSHVYLEMYYEGSTGETNYEDLNSTWRILDYTKNSFDKAKYLYNTIEPENYPETFFPFIRYRSEWFDTARIVENMSFKEEWMYQNYKYKKKHWDKKDYYNEYKEKGYNSYNYELQPEQLVYKQAITFEEKPLTSEAEKSLRKILEYCEKNQIEITLYSAPIYRLQLYSTGNYDLYVKQLKEIALEYKVSYYDFNLCRDEYLPMQKTEFFRDMSHLNDKGAEIFTPFFWQVMQQKDANNYFYSSYAEKCEEQESSIYGLIEKPEWSDKERWFEIASNRPNEMEYRIILTPDEGEAVMLQEFADNKVFAVDLNTTGICTIVGREKETGKVQTKEIRY